MHRTALFAYPALAASILGCGGTDQTTSPTTSTADSSSRVASSSATQGTTHSTTTASTGGGGASSSGHGTTHSSSTGGAGSGGDGGAGGAAPTTCNGYEPCGVNPVVAPTGYTIEAGGITVFDQSMNTTCADFSDCHMWNTHFTSNWNPPDTWNRMGSPFPWVNSRYIVSVPPLRITYAKLHMMAPNEVYAYSDGTKEMHTDATTGVTTCYARGPGRLMTGDVGSMNGTGNLGFVDFNISVLPGDMGNTGNVSTCQGSGATVTKLITADEATAMTMTSTGKYQYCLLREGRDYYVNFMSSGHPFNVDCSTDACTMGGFAFSNPTTLDGSPFVVQVPCN